MSNKGIKTLAKWGIIIVLFGFIIENLSTALPLIILGLLGFVAIKGLKNNPRRK